MTLPPKKARRLFEEQEKIENGNKDKDKDNTDVELLNSSLITIIEQIRDKHNKLYSELQQEKEKNENNLKEVLIMLHSLMDDKDECNTTDLQFVITKVQKVYNQSLSKKAQKLLPIYYN